MSSEVVIPTSNDTITHGNTAALQPLRVWPAVVLILSMIVCRLIPMAINDGPPMIWMVSSFGPLVCSLLMLIWWVTFSRASGWERMIGLIGAVSALGVTALSLHSTMVGPGMALLTVPVGMSLFGLTSVALRQFKTINRTFTIVLLTAAGFGSTLLLRAEGMRGGYTMDLASRWTPSIEDQLLTDSKNRQGTGMADFPATDVDAWLSAPEWPSFRGINGAAQQQGTVISSDWSASPPQKLWKISVGPAWSSFAVAGELLFTQEQRGSNESVVCYAANTGKEVWTQQIESRFWDPLGGPGPRATPTLANGGLFVQGATGNVLKLDARTGDILWQQDLRELADREPLEWGYSSSPLVLDSEVIVYAGGDGDRGVFGLNTETGEVQWSVASGSHSYSSPALVKLLDQQFIAMLTNNGVHLIKPQTGEVKLNYEWPYIGYRAVQPRIVDGNSLLLPTGNGAGTRRIEVSTTEDKLTAKEMWTSKDLKPDFNDFVIHQGHAFGFNNQIIACIDLSDGEAKWKGGRYGKGQLILLADSDLLLVLGESGEVVLLKASSNGHEQLAKIQALEGKTWNHPVVVRDRLFIRNFQEASCWKLPVIAGTPVATMGTR